MRLDDIHSNLKNICLRCGNPITLNNWTGWEAFLPDGETTQPICKFCMMVEDTIHEKVLLPPAPESEEKVNIHNLISNVNNLHTNVASDVWPEGTWLHCPICNHWEHITSYQCGYYLGHGWPKCCGHTMHTNDKPP